MIEIIPAIIPQDIDELIRAVHTIAPFSDKVHLDVDDGVFTPHVSWPYTGADMRGKADISMIERVRIEAHLMAHDPRMLGVDLVHAGVQSVIGHIETCTDARDAEDMLTMWRTVGAREAGLAILMDTPIERVTECAPFCDVIQIMSIGKVGAQSAPFDPRAIERIHTLRMAHPDLVISVDGGVSRLNVADLVSVGAVRFCVGSAIMGALDPAAAYQLLLASAHVDDVASDK